jgi:hypothetical protein
LARGTRTVETSGATTVDRAGEHAAEAPPRARGFTSPVAVVYQVAAMLV